MHFYLESEIPGIKTLNNYRMSDSGMREVGTKYIPNQKSVYSSAKFNEQKLSGAVILFTQNLLDVFKNRCTNLFITINVVNVFCKGIIYIIGNYYIRMLHLSPLFLLLSFFGATRVTMKIRYINFYLFG